MNLLLTELLNLSGVVVEEWQQTESELMLSVEMEKAYANCPRCGEVSQHLHNNEGYGSGIYRLVIAAAG
jgi:transposase